MDGSRRDRIDQAKARRRFGEDLKDILAEYFAGGIDEDVELARVMDLDLEEVRRLRREYES